MTADIAFTDVETTGLDPDKHCLWEVAICHRFAHGGAEKVVLYQVRPDLTNADPKALDIGQYAKRFVVPDGFDAARIDPQNGSVIPVPLAIVQQSVHRMLARSVMMGSNPGFDAGFIKKLLNGNTPWHYRPVDIVTLAASRLGMFNQDAMPWSSEQVSRALNVDPNNYHRHSSLGDALWVRDMYDALI